MQFSTSFEVIQILLAQTEEFVRIKEEEDNFPLDSFFDLRPALRRIKAAGSWIDQGALSELRKSLLTINGIVGFLNRDDEKEVKYPNLMLLTENVVTFPEITKRIEIGRASCRERV